jgi:hypothetical protein
MRLGALYHGSHAPKRSRPVQRAYVLREIDGSLEWSILALWPLQLVALRSAHAEARNIRDRRGPLAVGVYQGMIRRGIAWATHRVRLGPVRLRPRLARDRRAHEPDSAPVGDTG